MQQNDQRERPVVSALRQRAVIAQEEGVSATFVAPPRVQRFDTLIASAVLVLLLAGWMLNFVSFNELNDLTKSLGSYLVHSPSRQA
jgi:hypothetical protein